MLQRVKAITFGLIMLVGSLFGALTFYHSYDGGVDSTTYAYTDPSTLENPVDISDWSTAYTYRNNNGVITLTGLKYDDLYHYTIPAYINGDPVTTLIDALFEYNDYIYTLNFEVDENGESPVTTFGGRCFQYCENLQIITVDGEPALPSNLEYIGNRCFYYSSNLGIQGEEWVFPSTVYYIGESAFHNTRIRNINLASTSPDSLDSNTFSHMSQLTTVVLPSTLYYIDSSVFQNCNNLTSINLQDTQITEITEYLFYGCLHLVNLQLPSNLTSIGKSAFERTNIKELVIPNSVTSIDAGALPRSLEHLTFPANCQLIWGQRFNDMFENLWYSDDDGQAINYKLKEIKVVPTMGENMWCSVNGVLYTSDMTKLVKVPFNYEAHTYSVPATVNTIGFNALSYNTSLEAVVMGDNVKFIEGSVFAHTELISITLSNALQNIDRNAFEHSKKLVNITIPESTPNNYYSYYPNFCWAFNGCTSLKTITLPSSWTVIGDGMFNDCINLETIYWGNSIARIDYEAFKNCRNLTTIGSLANVEYIGYDAFYNCQKLTNITSLDSIVSIGSQAFYNCDAITSITMGANLEELDTTFAAFSGIQDYYINSANQYFEAVDGVIYANNRAQIIAFPPARTGEYTVPTSVNTLSDYSFYSSKLSKVNWTPGQITSISSYAFQNASIVGQLDLTGVEYIGDSAFYKCYNLTSVIMSADVESLFATFEGCTNLTTITFPSNCSLTSIGRGTFVNTSIRELRIPEGVVSITDALHYTNDGTNFSASQRLDYLYLPSTLKSFTAANGSTSRSSFIDTVELAEGMTSFNSTTTTSSIYTFNEVRERMIIPSTLTAIHNTNMYSSTILEIRGSVTDGTRSSILIPTNCNFNGKILVPANDLELYKSSSAWSKYASKIVSSLDVTVTFSNPLGTSFASQTIAYGTTPLNPGTPTCNYPEGVFAGWYYYDETTRENLPFNFGTSANNYQDGMKLYTDLTITATWSGIGADRYLEYELKGDGTYEIVGPLDESEFASFTELIIPAYAPDTTIPVTSIASHAFDFDSGWLCNIQTLIFNPNGSYVIGAHAFRGCNSITSVDLSGVTYIGNSAFHGCAKIATLNIPSSVAYVGSNAFSGCTRMTNLTWERGNNILAGISGGFIDQHGNIAVNTDINQIGGEFYTYYENGEHDIEFSTTLGEHIFVNCYALQSVQLPDNMYVIPARMFENCESLINVTFPTYLYRINANAFLECEKLASITLPDHLRELAHGIFSGTILTTANIPLNVKKIQNPFTNCRYLQSITVDSMNTTYQSIDGVLFYINDENSSASLVSYPEAKGTTVDFNQLVPTNYTSVGIYYYAFAGNRTLRRIITPHSATDFYIYDYAFANCTSLTAITFNSPNLHFGSWGAFDGCVNLNTMLIAKTLTGVPDIKYNFDKIDTSKILVYTNEDTYNMLFNSKWAIFNLMYTANISELYLILLENNGGEGVNSIVVAKGETIKVSNPTRVGYNFLGWYADEELTEEFDMKTTIEADLTIYAKWEMKIYTIKFNPNGGELNGETEDELTEEFNITNVMDDDGNPIRYYLDSPIKYGYNFDGWYSAENFNSTRFTYISSENLTYAQLQGTQDIEFYAKWVQVTYNMIVESSDSYTIGLSVDSTNPVAHGSTFKFTIIFKEGYTQNTPSNITVTATRVDNNNSSVLTAQDFDGIYYYIIEDINTNYNISIEGVKINKYIVTFVSQPTTVENETINMPNHLTIEHGKSISNIITTELPTPTKLGYSFNGWYRQQYNNVTGEIEYDDFVYDFDLAVTGDMNISAAWQTNTYIINYVLNGGMLGTGLTQMEYTIESAFLLPYNTDFTQNITRQGYQFRGWFDNEDFNGDEVTEIKQGTTGNLFFFAKWEPVVYQIEYNLNGGTIVDEYPTSYTIEQSIVLPIPQRAGFTFGGWNDKSDLSGNIITEIALGSIGKKHFYAVWESNVYVINYNLNGNRYSRVSINSVEVSYTNNYQKGTYIYGNETDLLTGVTRPGYTFGGWYESATFEGEPLTIITDTTIGDIDLYAKWTALPYKVILDFNDDNREIDGVVTPTEDYTINYTFDDFVANNGEIDLIDDPVWNELHIFVGWYTEVAGGMRYTSITPTNAISDTIRLYAHWETDVYKITILQGDNCEIDGKSITDIVKLLGGSGEIDKAYGSGIKFMVLITDEAYTQSAVAVKYKIGSNPIASCTTEIIDGDTYFVVNESITDNLNIYISNILINTYTVTFHSNGGSEVTPITGIKHGTATTMPTTNPTRDGYTFTNWQLGSGAGVMNWDALITSNIDLYASWYTVTYTANVYSGLTNELITSSTFTVESEVVFDSRFSSLVPSVVGYTFSHFECDDVTITTTQGITKDIDVIAIYNIITYTISYTIDSGYVETTNPNKFTVNTVYYEENGNVKETTSFELQPAVKANYTFQGWYYNNSVKVTTIPFEIDGTTVYDDIVLVANFTLTSDEYRDVSFYDGERLLHREAVYAGDTVSSITTEDKIGYTNTNKWYVGRNMSVEYNFDNPVTENLDLYIKYEIINYTITYTHYIDDDTYSTYKDLSNNSVLNFNPTSYNVESVIFLENPFVEGYTFTGWYLDGNPVDTINYSLNGTLGNITLQAKYEYITYNILYSVENGAQNNNANKSTFKIDDEVITLEDAIPVQGYHFVKWVLTTDITQTVTSIDPSTAQDYYLTAVFEVDKIYVYIELYIDGIKYSEIQNEQGTLLAVPNKPKTGYTLNGWYLESTYKTKFDFSKTTDENMALYAKYELVTYTIEYQANIDLSQPYPTIKEYTYEDTDKFVTTLGDEHGYKFVGWYTGAELVDDEYDFTNAIPFNGSLAYFAEDLVLTAKFEEIVYTITYMLDGGTNHADNPLQFTVNTPTIVLQNPTREGYTFNYWTRNVDGEEVVITNISIGTTENVVITANYTQNKTHITVKRIVWRNGIYYDLAEESLPLTNNQTFIPRNEPTRSGYVFDGWYTDEHFTVVFNLNIQYSKNVVMYGRLLPQQYSITYNYSIDGGQNATNPTTYTIEDFIVLNDAPAVAGYKFVGWYIDAVETPSGYDFSNATKVTNITGTASEVVLTAKYDIVTFKVQYFLDGGTNNPSNPTQFTVLSKQIVLFDPVAPEGYTFVAWVDSNDIEYTTIPEGYADNLVLTAKYAKDEEPESINKNQLTYVIIACGGIVVFFTFIIIVVVIKNNRRKAVDAKRIAALIEQINQVANRR